ncbi:MAG: hypothetical protein D6732_00340 [Methanobacteriota archaeon]|nr:MAG: hypothetical protein D6732_00340 [Euryarchaeota archaeon]
MSFDRRDLFGELANKIGAEDITDPFELLKKGDEEAQKGNHGKAKEFYEKAIATGKAKAQRFETNNQHRSAAEMNYVQALANLRLNNTEAAMALYSKIGTQLIQGGKNYIDLYKEYEDGVLLITLGGLVYVLQDRVAEAKELYLQMINEVEQKGQTGEIQQGLDRLKEILWTVGYIIKAIQDVDHSALQSAQQLISKTIRPNLKKAKVAGMEPLLNEIVSYTLNYFQSQIKLPKISLSTIIPPEMLVNSIFEVQLSAVNEGEGEAHSITLEFEIPSDLELVDGAASATFDRLSSGEKIEHKLSLRYQTSLEEDRTFDLKAKLSYKDMLNNEQVQFVGPISLEVTAKSKKDEYMALLTSLKEKWDGIKELGFDELIPDALISTVETLISQKSSDIEQLIEEQQYVQADQALKDLETTIKWSEEALRTGESFKELRDAIEKLRNEYAETKLSEAEEKHKQEIEETIDRINKIKEEERIQALQEKEAELNKKWENEIANLKKKHEDEINNLKAEHEKTLKLKLTELEEALTTQHRQQLDELNTKNERGIREIQAEYQADLEKKVEEARQNEAAKYEKMIEDLKQAHEEELRQITERLEEEKQNEIQSLEAKFEVEKENLRQQLRNEFEEEKAQAIQKAIDEFSETQQRNFQAKEREYLEKIEELNRTIARLESRE